MRKRLLKRSSALLVAMALLLSNILNISQEVSAESETSYESWAKVAEAAVVGTDYEVSTTTNTNDTYIIYTVEGLAWFAAEVNSGTSFSGVTITLANNIDLTTAGVTGYGVDGTVNWPAIGTDSYKYFAGTFNGNGFAISGVYITTDSDNQGLFGWISNATIQNVGVVNSSVSGGTCVGGVVGFASASTVTNCYNTGAVSASGSSSGNTAYVGGVVGKAFEATVKNCYNTGDVSGKVCINGNAPEVGGVVGWSYNDKVENCYNIGNVSGEEASNGSTLKMGGVLGVSYSSEVLNSYYNSKNITSILTSTTDGAGLTTIEMTGIDALANMNFSTEDWVVYEDYTDNEGTTYSYYPVLINNEQDPAPSTVIIPDFSGSGTSQDPYEISTLDDLNQLAKNVNDGEDYDGIYFIQTADIEITGTYAPIGKSLSEYFAGTYDGNDQTVSGIIDNSSSDYQAVFGYAYGATIENLNVSATVTGESYVSGIVGFAEYTIITNCTNTGDISGDNVVGGIVGRADYSTTVTNCYNTGDVSGSYYVGGVIGFIANSSQMKNCYNTGDVSGSYYVGGVVGYSVNNSALTTCYNTGDVSGSSDVGGVVGRLATSTLTSGYSIGNVSGSTYVGGVVGSFTSASVYYCYHNSENITSTLTNNFSTGLTTEKMTDTTALDTENMDGLSASDWIVTATVINEDGSMATYYYPTLSTNTQDPIPSVSVTITTDSGETEDTVAEVVTTGNANVYMDKETEEQLKNQVFTEEEIAENEELKVTLQVNIRLLEDMDEATRAEFDAYIEEYNEQLKAQGLTAVQALVFDISILKTIADLETTVEELDTPITITIPIPEEYQMEGREFFMLRNHNGTITILEDLDDDPTTITISTDRFSEYILNYMEETSDDTITESTDDTITESTDDTTNDADIDDTTEEGVPDTGDVNELRLWSMVLIVALVILVIIWGKRIQ